MTFPQSGAPTRALVLGGGGAVGVGWQTGLLTGLHEAGVDLAGANAIVGTSAGALVGALLASSHEVTDALISLASLGQSIDPESLAAGDEAFLSAIRQANLESDPRRALRAIGRSAKEASTIAEDIYLGLFSTLDGTTWPAGFRCTAIDIDSGELVVWGQRIRRAAAAGGRLELRHTGAVPQRHHQRPPLYGRRSPQSSECGGGGADRRLSGPFMPRPWIQGHRRGWCAGRLRDPRR